MGLSAYPLSLPLGVPPCPRRDLPSGASSPRWPSSLTAQIFPAKPFLIAVDLSPPGLPYLGSFDEGRPYFLPRGYLLARFLLPIHFLGPDPRILLFLVRLPEGDLWGPACDSGIWFSWILLFGGCAVCVSWGLLARKGNRPRGYNPGKPPRPPFVWPAVLLTGLWLLVPVFTPGATCPGH